MMTQEEFREHISSLTNVPAGFSGQFFEEDGWNGSKEIVYVLDNNAGTQLRFDQNGSGHTRFKVDGRGWLTFDRRGVEDSFYHLNPFTGVRTEKSLNDIVAEQLAKVEASRVKLKSSVMVPDVGHYVSLDGLEQLQLDLKARGYIQFVPSGFGTGYFVSKKPQQGLKYGERRASQELEKFLGVSPLYVCPFDCD